MRKKSLIIVVTIFMALSTAAQQIPLGSCGIVYIYDAAGNRTKRIYFCNNGGTYPSFAKGQISTIEVQEVDALYPNPSSAMVFLTFSKPLNNATINVVDVNGKIVQKQKASGNKISVNLSGLTAGQYFINIIEGDKVISKKVIKV